MNAPDRLRLTSPKRKARRLFIAGLVLAVIGGGSVYIHFLVREGRLGDSLFLVGVGTLAVALVSGLWAIANLLSYSAVRGPLGSWPPFQSDEVKAICAHMTNEEKEVLARTGAATGLWVVITGALPVVLLVKYRSVPTAIVACMLFVAYLISVPVYRKRVRARLCSTAWAKTQGYRPESLRLFRFRASPHQDGDAAGASSHRSC